MLGFLAEKKRRELLQGVAASRDWQYTRRDWYSVLALRAADGLPRLEVSPEGFFGSRPTRSR